MAAMELGSIQLEVEDDRNTYDVKKYHEESCLDEMLKKNTKQAAIADVDNFTIVRALQPLFKKDQVNEDKRAESVLERAFLKLGIQGEESFPTPSATEARTESSRYAYVEGIVRGCGDAFWVKVRKLFFLTKLVSCIYIICIHAIIFIHNSIHMCRWLRRLDP